MSRPNEGNGRAEEANRPPANRGLPQLDDLYREVVLDHYRNPRGRTRIPNPALCTEGFNPTCGDQVKVCLALHGDRIDAVEVHSHGCSISVAAGSMMAEILKGKSREEAKAIAEGFKGLMQGRDSSEELDLGDLEALSGVRQFPVRIKCALLAWTTLEEAMRYLEKPESSPDASSQEGS